MKKSTNNRIKVVILLCIALGGCAYANKKDAERMRSLDECTTAKYIVIDGEAILIPLD